MQDFLAAVAAAAARPSVLLLLLAVAGLALLLARRRLARTLLAAGAGGLALAVLLPLGHWAGQPLEDWYPRLDPEPARIDGIVVLGGASRLAVSRDRRTVGLNAEGERMTAFMALARRHPEARLVFAGGGHWYGWTEADAARLLFDAFGLYGGPRAELPGEPAKGEPGRVVYEDRSRNTWQNAVNAAALVHPQPGETWVLVTSALHMPRAMAAFRAAGWQHMVAAPAAYRTAGSWLDVPVSEPGERLQLLDAAAHEWIGLAAYWVTGRATPGPGAVATANRPDSR